MKSVKVLGTGCPKCKRLLEEAQKAVELAGVEAQVDKVDQIDEILEYGVMMTPALVVDGEIKSHGKVPSSAQIAEWLKE